VLLYMCVVQGPAGSGNNPHAEMSESTPLASKGEVVPDDLVIPVYFDPPGREPRLRPCFMAEEITVAFGADHARHLGTGGFGESWLLQTGSGRVVAKVLHNRVCPRDRITREIEGLSRLRSPRVVRLLDVRDVDLRSDLWPALLFEYIEGGSVNDRLAAGDWPTTAEAMAFATALLEGLVFLHANNAVHRDLKPANVALRRAGWGDPVILDLGLVKVLDLPAITPDLTVIGTPAFMAPEQLRRQQARKQADMWAVGVLLHLLLAHEHPFFDQTLLDERLALRRIQDGPRPLPETVTGPLRVLVERLLHPIPHERGSAARALAELQAVVTQ
jgi:serine/threonine protein kinase